MEEKFYYLYSLTNMLNKKTYIGQTVQPKTRWKTHKHFAKHPEKTNQYIHRAMNKHGIENFVFEVIATCKTESDADETEAQLIEQYNSRNKDFGYNLKPGAPSRKGFKQSEETKKKMSEEWHLHHSLEDLKKMQEGNIGRVPSEEQRRKVSEANKGNQFCLGHKQSQETIDKRVASILEKHGGPRICCVPECGKTCHFIIEEKRYCSLHGQRLRNTGSLELKPRVAHNKGKSMSEESKQKLSNSLKGRTAHNKGQSPSDETKEKLRLLNLGKEPPNKTKFSEDQIAMILLDNRSLRTIAKDFNVSTTVIQRIKKSKTNYA